MDAVVYALLNKKIRGLVSGVQSASVSGTTITFTMNDGSKQSITFPVPKDGISITDVNISETNHLICTMSDGSKIDAGEFPTFEPILENDLTSTTVIGSITNGKKYVKGTPLETIIRDMLTEKIAPKVTLSISPSKTLYDIVTEKISSLTINATVTKQTYDVAKITYYINDAVVKENTTNVSNGGSFPYIHNTEINDTVVIKVVVTDTGGLKTTVTKKIEFYPVIYYGIVDAETGEPTEAMIKTLSSKLQNTKVFTYEGITTDWGKVCVAIPKALGTISQILDPVNALSYNSSFSTVTVKVNGYDYSVLTQIDPSAASGITLKFS